MLNATYTDPDVKVVDVDNVSNASAIRYRLDSFRDLNNKVVYLVNKYLNYTERSIAVVISHRSKIQCLRLY